MQVSLVPYRSLANNFFGFLYFMLQREEITKAITKGDLRLRRAGGAHEGDPSDARQATALARRGTVVSLSEQSARVAPEEGAAEAKGDT